MRRDLYLKTSLFFFTSLVPTIALALPATPYVPPSAQPSRNADQNLQLDNQLPAVGGPSVITVPDESGHQKPLKDSVSFTLASIKLENATALPKEKLDEIYKPYIGKKISLSTLNEIASKITVEYRNAGYILSRAVVPPQRINNGVVTIRIVEGFVSNVVFEGAPTSKLRPFASHLLEEYADKIRAAKPLSTAVLERYLLLIEDLPGMTAQAVLRPSTTTPGASDVVITLSERTITGAITADNRGSRYIGPYEGGITINVNNALGLYDSTQLRGLNTSNLSEETFGEITHIEQLDSEGTKLSISAGETETNPGYKLKEFDIHGVDDDFSAVISHPFIRSRQTNLYGDVEFDIRDTHTDTLSTPFSFDPLRVARIGGSYDFVDRFLAVNKFDVQVSKGVSWFDSTAEEHSIVDGQTSFYKATAQASRLQPISGPFGLYIASKGQLASDSLLSAEQFGLGGADFGSAYDPSEITGDSGIAGRAELQYSRSGDFWLVPTYQLYGFYDIGEVWTRNPSAGIKPEESLASLGFGTRFNILEPLSANVEVAFPMTRPVAADNSNGNGNSPRVFFSLAYRY